MYVLDTDTIIYFFKGSQGVIRKIINLDKQSLATTIINKIELLYGAYHSKKRNDNLKKLNAFFEEITVLDLDHTAANHFATEKSRLTKSGKTVADFDLLIASICLSNKLPLVSNNIKHFDRIKGLKLENWYDK